MTSYKTTLTKMMRQTLTALAALLMVGAMASCSENQDIETAEGNNDAYLNLCFSTHAGSNTRAGEATGNIPANNESKESPQEESDIHNIKVWVFVSGTGDNAKPISYKAETLSTVANSQYALNLRFLRKIAGKEVENIDLYILANSESINMADQLKGKDLQSLTRKDLKDVCFSNPFGITSRDGSPESTAVTDAGLPISRAITDISVAGHIADTEAGAKNKGIKIPLVRAVSKLHFYFTRQAGAEANTDNVKVTRIDINGYTIPTESYVFPDEEKYEEAGMNQNATSKKYNEQTTQYVAAMLLLPGVKNEDIKAVADPESFKKSDSQSAQEYLDAFSKEGIQSHNLCYLRETNKAIKGTIYYQLNGTTEKCETFSLPTKGYAIRNRELVVYGYFLKGGKLCLDYKVLPWNLVSSEIRWDGVSCNMFAWKYDNNSWPIGPQKGDAEAVNCMVSKPGFYDNDSRHETAKAGSTEAAFYFKLDAPAGTTWKAHLSNEEDFCFNSGKTSAWTYQNKSYKTATTGIARELPYQIKIGAKQAWWEFNPTNAKDFSGKNTSYGDRYDKAYQGTNPQGIYTDFYITVSLDGIHEYELTINPTNQGGRYKEGRKFCGTDTRIRIYNVRTKSGLMYDAMQKDAYNAVYKKYLEQK